MRWNEFQQTAERLAQGRTEGDWRSAISRSYYAVFHYFREFLLSHGLNLGAGAPTHFSLYSGLMNCGQATVAPLAATLDLLRSDRGRADYDLRRAIGQAEAQNAVHKTRTLMADFQALLATLPAAQLVAGARSHLQSIGRLPRTP